MKRDLLIGDLFQFADNSIMSGYGQILRSDILQFIVIFEPMFPRNTSLEHIANSSPLLSGWTMDARFHSGDWKIVGNVPLHGEYAYPRYQVIMSGKPWVTDVEGNPLRLATAEEAKTLTFKSSDSPIAFEKAYKAYHGIIPWEHRFDRLLVKSLN